MKLKRLSRVVMVAIATLLAASFAEATALNLSGTENRGAYLAYFGDYAKFPQFYATDPGMVTPVAAGPAAGPWVPGQWITYSNADQSWPMDQTSGNLPGTYYYMTEFSLAGLLWDSVVIKGSWASDNGSQLFLNSTQLIGTSSGYSTLTDFTIDKNNVRFDSDYNFLTFVVTNDTWGNYPYLNPTGLLVNIYQATADPIPEPSTLILLGGGLLGLGLARKRGKR